MLGAAAWDPPPGLSRGETIANAGHRGESAHADDLTLDLARVAAPAQEVKQILAGIASLPVNTTYYLDSANGADSNSGTSATSAWRSVQKASNSLLRPGDRLLLGRGQTFVGELSISESGTAAAPIVVGAFGDGAQPVITGGGDCVEISGSQVVVHGIHLDNCSWAGLQFATGASFNIAAGNVMTRNVVGAHAEDGSANNRIVGNQIADNTKMSRLTSTPDNDDSGAFGVLLNGDMNEVGYNVISGHDTFSYDYGRDGAAVEVFGGQSNRIHHNLALENDAFSELGNPRSSANTFDYNVVRSSLPQSIFLVTRGAEDRNGPVLSTRLHNNTVLLTGANSQGFVCHAGCGAGILFLRNNIFQASLKAGYADGAIDEDHNLYYGGQVQLTMGPNSIIANPRFSDAAGGVLNLRADSPAIDAGVLASSVKDFEGRPVPQDGDGDNSAVTDMGAFEFVPGASVSAVLTAIGPTPTRTPSPTPTRTPTPTPTRTPGPSPKPTATPLPSPTLTPTPLPVAPAPVQPPPAQNVMVGAGDIASCGTQGDEATANLPDAIAGTVFTLGDHVYEDGTPQEFSDCYQPSWGRHKWRTRPSAGNHDYHVANASGYYGYFGPAAGEAGKGYYSYNVGSGSWHVIVLNSECSKVGGCASGSPQGQWLQADLAANPTLCTVAYWHRPVRTIGPHSDDEGGMLPLWRVLYDYKVELVINAHEHNYQRYAPLNRDANAVDSVRGMREIVVGTGGKGLTNADPARAGAKVGLEVWGDRRGDGDGHDADLGVLKLVLNAGNYSWQFIPIAGASFTDAGTGSCR